MKSRTSLQLNIQLNHIHCFDEGDGPGNAEPYLWTLFYKIDGDTFRFGNDNDPDEQLLWGAVTIEKRNPLHGNLNRNSVDEGDIVAIPPAVGKWETVLRPIPVTDNNKSMVAALSHDFTDLPGIAGVVVILMEEDNLSNDAVQAGYDAFCATFQAKMNQLINGRDLVRLAAGITDEMENDVEAAVREAVESAIPDSMNFFEKVWNWLAGPDQTLGSASFRFGHDDLVRHGQILFRERWKEGVSVTTPLDVNVKEFIIRGPGRVIESGGEWEIFGQASATLLPVEQFIGEFGPPVTFTQSELAIQSFRHRSETARREGYPGAYPTFKTVRDKYGNEFGTTVFFTHEGAERSNISWYALGMPDLEDFIARMKSAHTYAVQNGYVSGLPAFYEAPSILGILKAFENTSLQRWTGNTVGQSKPKPVQQPPVRHSSLALAGSANGGRHQTAAHLSDELVVSPVKPQQGNGLLKHQTLTEEIGKINPVLNSIECSTVFIKPDFADVEYVKLADLGNPKLGDIPSRFIAAHDYAVRRGYVSGFPTFFDRNMSFEMSGFDLRCGTVLLKQQAAVVKDVLTFKALT
ncbi:hypothetical protein HF329_08855 [Chitinophaga oryzae]|uniref:Uncharacterized protein n=1 Tax=Chitinophaga oryzae TaxID=2725414 RepID=A0AAE6ZEC5_9BACT|nr:hypothetical protein [Chitinophaga oryzae]QJB31402.1 hypothetical protein HF329_08855 [Chitinophaga oryzae]